MAVTNVHEDAEAVVLTIDDDGYTDITREFIIQVDSLADGPLTALAALPVQYGDLYHSGNDDDDSIWARSVNHKKDSSGLAHRFTVKYSNKPKKADGDGSSSGGGEKPGNDNKKQANTPEARPWTFTFSSRQTNEIFRVDKSAGSLEENWVPVLNTAKVPFDPPVEMPHSYLTIGITAYRSGMVWHADQFVNTINADFVTFGPKSFAARTLRVTKFDVSATWEGPSLISTLTIEVEHNPDTWDVLLLDAGLHERFQQGVNMFIRPIKDPETGKPITKAVPMNGQGKPLGFNALGVPTDPFVYLTYHYYKETDFTKLISG
jgi:hypothetical protein